MLKGALMNKIIQYGVLFLFSVMCYATDAYAGMGPIRRVLDQARQRVQPARPTPIPRPPVPRPPMPHPRPPVPLPRPTIPPQPRPPRPPITPVDPGAPPQVSMLDVNYLGTGCADGTIVPVMSPDQQVISILFSDYITQAGPGSGRSQDSKNCQMQIPLVVSNGGYQFMITRVDFRGLAALPAGSEMAATGSYSITSPDYPNIRPQSFSVRTNSIYGPATEDYLFSVEPILNNGLPPSQSPETKWSACSSRFTMTITSRLDLVNRSMQEDALASVDSIDASVQPGIEYQMKWRRCR